MVAPIACMNRAFGLINTAQTSCSAIPTSCNPEG